MAKKRYRAEQIVWKLREAEIELARVRSVLAACKKLLGPQSGAGPGNRLYLGLSSVRSVR